jgi:hypothetical protein
MVSAATLRTHCKTISIASKIGWKSEASRHWGRELFRTRKRYLGLSCRHVRADDKVSIVCGGRLLCLCARQVYRWPNTPGPQVNDEATPMVAHEPIGRYCYVHAFVGGQGQDMATRRGIGCEKDSPGLRKSLCCHLDLPQLSGI